MAPRNKALAPETNERLRKLVKEIVDKDFDGKKTLAARGLGISHSLVFEFLDGGRGAGSKFLDALADYTGKSIDELMGRAPATTSGHLTTWGNVPGWDVEAEKVRRDHPYLPREVFQRAASTSGSYAPNPMTAEFVLRAALFVWQNMSLREQAELAAKETEAAIKKHVRDAERKERKKAEKSPELPGVRGAANETGER
jgi:hypothetical protein